MLHSAHHHRQQPRSARRATAATDGCYQSVRRGACCVSRRQSRRQSCRVSAMQSGGPSGGPPDGIPSGSMPRAQPGMPYQQAQQQYMQQPQPGMQPQPQPQLQPQQAPYTQGTQLARRPPTGLQRMKPTGQEQTQVVFLEMSQVVGKQVITFNGGRNLGVISTMWVDPVQMVVVSLDISDKKGVGSQYVCNFPLSQLRQIGDVVLVLDDSVLYGQPLDGRYGYYILTGMEIRTQNGNSLGKVRDYTFSPDNGTIDRIVYDEFGLPFLPMTFFDTFSLPMAEVISLGVGGLIVSEEARYRERRESPGLFAAIPSLLRSISSGGNRVAGVLTDGSYRQDGVAGYLPQGLQGYTYQQWENDVRRWEQATGMSYEQYQRTQQQQRRQIGTGTARAPRALPPPSSQQAQPQQPYRGQPQQPQQPQQVQQQQPGYGGYGGYQSTPQQGAYGAGYSYPPQAQTPPQPQPQQRGMGIDPRARQPRPSQPPGNPQQPSQQQQQQAMGMQPMRGQGAQQMQQPGWPTQQMPPQQQGSPDPQAWQQPQQGMYAQAPPAQANQYAGQNPSQGGGYAAPAAGAPAQPAAAAQQRPKPAQNGVAPGQGGAIANRSGETENQAKAAPLNASQNGA